MLGSTLVHQLEAYRITQTGALTRPSAFQTLRAVKRPILRGKLPRLRSRWCCLRVWLLPTSSPWNAGDTRRPFPLMLLRAGAAVSARTTRRRDPCRVLLWWNSWLAAPRRARNGAAIRSRASARGALGASPSI